MDTEPLIWGIPLTVRSGFKYFCLIAVSWRYNNVNFQRIWKGKQTSSLLCSFDGSAGGSKMVVKKEN